MKRDAAAIVGLGTALFWAYGSVVAGLVAQWRHDENYSHGFLVLPIAVFIAWQRRRQLQRTPLQPALAGAAVVAVSLADLHRWTIRRGALSDRVSLIGVLAGTIAFVWGRAHLRILAFPLAFLLFMVPLPAIVFNQLTLPLQLVASSAGELVIRASRHPHSARRQRPAAPGRTLEVAGGVQRHPIASCRC